MKTKKFQINFGTNIQNQNLKNSYFGIDYKVDKEISIGLNSSWSENIDGGSYGNTKRNGFIIQFQTNYDWANKIGLNSKKIDFYTGFNGGYAFYLVDQVTKTFNESQFTIGGQVGIRYLLTKNIGINAELNGGVVNNNAIRAGISLKF